MLNHFKSVLKSALIKIDFLSKFPCNKESILFRKILAYLMHLATYNRDPNKDWAPFWYRPFYWTIFYLNL